MLKNWTVTTQAVKNGTDGVVARERYLLAQKHPNHRCTEELLPLFGNTSTTRRIALAGEQFRLKQQLNKKGGRPLSSYAMEYCLSLPKGHRPTLAQWKNVVADCCKALAEMLQFNSSEMKSFQSQIRAVLHQQEQTNSRGAGDHVHLVVGKVVDGRVLKALQQKQGTKILKSAFNTAVLTHIGIDHRDYKPHELSRGERLEKWQYEQRNAAASLEAQKLIKKLQNQADRWFDARLNSDIKQQQRQINRLKKTFEELSDVSLSDSQTNSVEQLKNKFRSHT